MRPSARAEPREPHFSRWDSTAAFQSVDLDADSHRAPRALLDASLGGAASSRPSVWPARLPARGGKERGLACGGNERSLLRTGHTGRPRWRR